MERDDIIEYAQHDHHGEEEGKKVRKKIWFVFWVLLIVTAVEVLMGAFQDTLGLSSAFLKWSFIIMTFIKAFYIVATFMHLGDEKKAFRYFILLPYGVFIAYAIFILLYEGGAVGESSGKEQEGGEKAKKEAWLPQERSDAPAFTHHRALRRS